MWELQTVKLIVDNIVSESGNNVAFFIAIDCLLWYAIVHAPLLPLCFNEITKCNPYYNET